MSWHRCNPVASRCTLIRKRTWSAAVFALSFVLIASSSTNALQAQVRAVWSPTRVAQTNGTTIKMPLKNPVSRSSRLTLTVDNRWAQNYGYRPVEVTVSSSKPVAEDRTVLIRLHSGWSGPIQVEQEFTLPKGSTTASVRVPVPQYQMATSFCWWDVWIDGIKDYDLSLAQIDAYNVMQGGYSGTTGKTFLAMNPKADQRTLMAPNSMEFEVLSLAASEFPTRWIEYTCMDAVTLSMSELQQLSRQHPAAFQAISRWVRSGGQLWVNDVGSELERIRELSQLFQVSEQVVESLPKDSGGNANISAALHPGWRPVLFNVDNPEGQVATFLHIPTGNVRTVRDPNVITRLQGDSDFSLTGLRFESAGETSSPIGVNDSSSAGETPSPIHVSDSSSWFVEQRFGLGRLRAFRQTNEVSQFDAGKQLAPADAAAVPTAATTLADVGSSEQLPLSLTTALQSLGRWGVRHGVLPDDASVEFPNLLVPGVGMAPVSEFRVLITLFVLLIGPVNYWLLKRWRRLHLMVLTVPLAAGMVTLALFAYAIASDGFGTKVRAHSFTALDQRSGEAVCWTRLSYYSGLAPGGGLTMPVDVALYPIIPNWNEYSAVSYVQGERLLRWEDDQAKLLRGWLRSRTPMQYLTIRSRKSPHRLELTPVRDRLRVKNSLSATAELIVVIDDSRKFWIGEKLQDGAVAFLKPIEQSEAAGRFRKLAMANAPQLPDALAAEGSRYSAIQRQRRRFGGFMAYSGEQSLSGNLANETISRLAGLAGGEGLDLPPRSYVAVTSTGPEVEFGMDGVEEEDSFHIIMGQW